jgi:hypothetical protein
MINCIIAEELMPTPALCTCPPSLCHGYAFAAECILLETISPPSHSTVHFIGAIIYEDTGNVLKYRQLMKMNKHKKVWAHGFASEIGRLIFQGIRNVPGTNTCFFIPKSLVPAHKRPTYGRICCNYQPQKEEKHCIRLTVGGDWIDYPGNKRHQRPISPQPKYSSITIRTPGANFLGIDLANFYLNTPIPNPKYMRLRLGIIPNKFINHYNLCGIVTPDGWVYIEIWKRMYGLPHAGILANQLLKKHLAIKGYYQCQHTPGLWRHIWRYIMFCLGVNDFGIKVTNKHDMDHLVNALKEHCTVAIGMMHDGFSFLRYSSNLELHTRTR